MDISLALLLFSAVTCYLLWLTFISKSIKGPRVWPLLGSLPDLIENSERMHELIADNLRGCGGTYQTCILKSTQLEAEPVDLQDLLLRLTFNNIYGLAFGKDPNTLAAGQPDSSFAWAFDRATNASLQRFILPEIMWKLKKWLRLGMEISMSQILVQVDEYLSGVINAR